MVQGVPDSVDGLMQVAVGKAGGNLVNTDRFWHYPEGIKNHSPVWTNHAIRILSGPSPLWLDARGRRFPAPLFPGFDALGALRHITSSGYDWSWFLLDAKTIAKEFALSGSEQNPDLTGKDIRMVLQRGGGGPTAPVQRFMDVGEDFVVRPDLRSLVDGMNALTGEDLIAYDDLHRLVSERDLQIASGLGKDPQVTATTARAAFPRRPDHRGSRHRIVISSRQLTAHRRTAVGPDPQVARRRADRPVLRVLRADGSVFPGLWAAGEVAGFGGGGVHGYRALEGTFLGGCLFSGRIAGRALADATA